MNDVFLYAEGLVGSDRTEIEHFIGQATLRHIGVELNIAIASVLAAASLATILLAYRSWCRADLD